MLPGRTQALTLVSRVSLRFQARAGQRVLVLGRIAIRGGGRILIGNDVVLDAREAPIELHVEPGAELRIGDGAHLEGGVSLEAQRGITVGAGARLGPFVKVLDSHFHSVRGDRQARPTGRPVDIGSGAQVGANAILLPGAVIRENAVVPAAAVVRGPPAGKSPDEDAAERPASSLAKWVSRQVAVLRAQFQLAGCEHGVRVATHGRIVVENRGRLSIGDRVSFTSDLIPVRLVCHPGAELEVGAETFFNYGSLVEAHQQVRIGARCLIASAVRICDRDGDGCAPVIVGDDVWVAHGATLLPGASVGSGSVISAGSVVKGHIPPDSLAAGRPARAIPLDMTRGERVAGVERVKGIEPSS